MSGKLKSLTSCPAWQVSSENYVGACVQFGLTRLPEINCFDNLLGTVPSGYSKCAPKVTSISWSGLALKNRQRNNNQTTINTQQHYLKIKYTSVNKSDKERAWAWS